MRRTNLFVFIFLLQATAVLSDKTEPCQNYVTCLEKLEEKQRECRDDTIQRRQLRATLNGEDEDDDDDEDDPQQCSKKQNRELHDELTGLHLRKTEVIKDCVKKNLEHAVINGTEESNKKCVRTFEKLINFKPKKTKKRGGKKQRKMSQKKADLKCRKERKMLHKKCTKIAACCSLSNSCHQKTNSIINQIVQIKLTLKQNREACKNQ